MTDKPSLIVPGDGSKILKPPKQRVIREQRCENCKFGSACADPSKRECRRYPPFASPIPVQDPQGNMATATHTTFPFVHIHQWCGEYKRAVAK